jgi:mannose-6-phosphate isomerase-like protein (cupin superfamily)
MHATIEPSMTRRNAFNGETFIFSHAADDPDVARFDVVLERGGSGGGNALTHVHPHAAERFVVRKGRLKIMIQDAEHVIEAGESAVVPRGAPHYFVNANDGTTEMTVEFRPAQQFVRFFANFSTLAERHPEWFSKEGDPNLLLIALTLHTYRDHLYLARPPIAPQKVLFAMLAPLARWRGYRVEIAPRRISQT